MALQTRENKVLLSVRDSGIGIPPAMLARIFDPFVQVDGAHPTPHGGLGVGLTLVKRLTELHGGDVEGRSLGIGQGSEFVVRLPPLERNPDRHERVEHVEI